LRGAFQQCGGASEVSAEQVHLAEPCSQNRIVCCLDPRFCVVDALLYEPVGFLGSPGSKTGEERRVQDGRR